LAALALKVYEVFVDRLRDGSACEESQTPSAHAQIVQEILEALQRIESGSAAP
jgi:hypothetical protein